MKVYQIKTSQVLPISLSTAWEFFSDPRNLSKITPEWLDFEILTELPRKMYAGMIIVYKIRPILNLPTRWVTEITHVNEPFYFVDEQRFGPYRMWHHEHIFKEIQNNSVQIQDIVSYTMPFGFLGEIVNNLFIKNRVLKIFEYRKEILKKTFGASENSEEQIEYLSY